jgi:chemotaxis response regulator CheB
LISFCNPLSKACEELAGCVILSGTSSDGTHGLRLIREAGEISAANFWTSAGN